MRADTRQAHGASADSISALVVEQADRLFQHHVTGERLTEADRGRWPAEVWHALEEAGLPLAFVPEAQGGSALPAADAMRLIRRAGYWTLPVPLAETVVAAKLWADAAGSALEGVTTLSSGTLAIEPIAGGYRVEGRLDRVAWGAEAANVLALARDGAGRSYLVLVPPSAAEIRPRRNVAYEPRPTMLFAGAVLPEECVCEAPPHCRDGVMVFGALLRAHQMVGAMERCLDYALSHANERRQFGRPLAKFQAIQHMLAGAAGHWAAAAASADGAGEAWGRPEFRLATAIAKARVGDAAGKVAAICHQVHGAMGFTQEHPLHFATRRLWSWRDEFGADAFWEEEIGRLVCAQGGEALWDTLVGVTHLQSPEGEEPA